MNWDTQFDSFFSLVVLFLDLFGLLFLIVKVVFVPLLRLIQQKTSGRSTSVARKSRESYLKSQAGVLGESHS